MKVILLSNIDNLGKKGEILNVKRGYARNYLIPRNLALYATPINMKKLGSIQAKAMEEEERLLAELKKLDARLRGTTLSFIRKVDENDHMFGSVSEADIVAALAEYNITLHKSLLLMDKHIKVLGESRVQVRLHRDIVSELRIMVEKEGKPASEDPGLKPEPEVEISAPEETDTEV